MDMSLGSNNSIAPDEAYIASDLFAIDDSSTCSKESCDESHFSTLDECIDAANSKDMFPLSQLIRGHRPTKRQKTKDLKPLAFVRFNTRIGKPKPVTLKALLDSGATESLVSKKHTQKLRRKNRPKGQTWSTPGGMLTTTKEVTAQFTLPELQDKQLIEWKLHEVDDLGAYDMIIGRDILQFLQMDLCFSDQTVRWGENTMPFKDKDASVLESYHIRADEKENESTERLKRILDAKYEKADLRQICESQTELSKEEQRKLFDLLSKYEHVFDGTLGTWSGSPVDIELLPDAKPYHARSFPVPKCHYETLKIEVERLVKLGVLRKVNRSEWAAPTFLIPKKDGTVRFISDFRELNKRIKRKPYPIPNIQDLLMNLEGFQYATSLDLNMGYYHLELNEKSKQLCAIVLPFGKFEYQRIPMGLCNSPDIFQEKMNELFTGLDFVRAYIDDLLCISKGTFDDHLEKVDKVLERLSHAGLKVNAGKSFFASSELEYLGYWITREGIQPMTKKVEAILRIDSPKNKRELRGFIGVVNYYRDMWLRRSHVLAPLARLTSKTAKWTWTDKEQAAFDLIKRIMAKEVTLAYPNFEQPFEIHTDASHYQLGAVISQNGKPITLE